MVLDLIQKEPDCINFKTMLMETIPDFVVKKDHMVCAELLLRWGANSQVLYLHRERPINLAKSQDMRFLLKAANTYHTNLAFFDQEKQNTSLESDEDISEALGAFLSMIDNGTNTSFPAHFETIMVKQIEITSVMPKHLLFTALQKRFAQQRELKHEHRSQLQTKIPGERTMEETTSRKVKEEISISIIEEITPDEKSCAGRLLYGQAKAISNEPQDHAVKNLGEKSMPKWLRTFKKWLPRFLKDVYRHENPLEGKYALSSLKIDFKAAYGLELEHASIGYPKLSDFMRTLPHLCRVKAEIIGTNGSSNHMVVVPSFPRRRGGALRSSKTEKPSSPVNPTRDDNRCDPNDSRSSLDLQSVSASGTIEEEKPTHEVPEGSSAQTDTSTCANSAPNKALDSSLVSEPGPSNNGNVGGLGGQSNERGRSLEISLRRNPWNQERHVVLNWVSRKRNNNSFFTRGPDFIHDYNECVRQKNCFGCKEKKMLFVNTPCNCLLWCCDCRQEATEAASGSKHFCVICDKEVEDIILNSDLEEFPSFSLANTRNLSKRNRR